MKYKNLILSIMFVLVALVVSSEITDVLKFKQFSNNSKSKFYSENIDYDVIFLGASSVHFGISPLYLFNQYGLSSYILAMPGCQYDDFYAVTQEAIKEKNTKLYIVDYKAFLLQGTNPDFAIGNIASINNPFIRFNTYYKEGNFTKALQNTNLYYLFHNRWKEITEKDFYTLAYLRGYSSEAWVSDPEFTTDNKTFQLSDTQKKQIDEYISLLAKNNIKLILIAPPTTWNDKRFSDTAANSVKDYVSKYNIEFIDLKDLSYYNTATDFQSNVHLNFQGSKKLMNRQDFIPYIMKQYNLQDHRNDKQYAKWYKDYEEQERMINREELKLAKDFNKWWNYANYDNYSLFISVKGENVLNRLPNDFKDKFKSIGLSKYETNNNDDTYAAIVDDDNVFYEYIFNKPLGTYGRVNNKFNMQIVSDKYNAIINISGKPQSKNKYGINFVVYDNINRKVVDSMWVDPEDFNKVNR